MLAHKVVQYLNEHHIEPAAPETKYYKDGELVHEVDIQGKLGYDLGHTSFAYDTIEIGAHVTSIGESAFAEVSTLKKVVMADSVTEVGDWAFQNCTSLQEVTLSKKVTKLGDGAFKSCKIGPSFWMPNTVTWIGDGCFSKCNELTEITLSNSLTHIGSSVWNPCKSLQTIYCDSEREPTTVGGGCFYLQTTASGPWTLHVKAGGSAATYPTWMDDQGNLGLDSAGEWIVEDDL